jgi:hypothetical protein
MESLAQNPAAQASQPEAITIMQSPLSDRASLETIPLEILSHIFVLTCSEDLDLNLLQVSRAITWKLFDHPISRTVRAFWPVNQHSWDFKRSLDKSLPVHPGGTALACDRDKRERIRKEVLQSAWCNSTFIRRMQVAFIRRMVKKLWDPFLERDGLEKCARSHPNFWGLLDRAAYGDMRSEEENLEICLKDNETRYSWTRIRIWPWQGRIVIRDQLLNKSFEKTLPFLECVLIHKTCLGGQILREIGS